jgi:preprotein translocase subunit SecG
MDFLLVGSFSSVLLGFSLFFISLFLIFLVLIQRGRGGGLSGALGGTGQSAFGSKAGDEMTYITLIVSAIWILLCIVCIWVLNPLDANRLIDDDDVQQTSGSDGTNSGLDLGGQLEPEQSGAEAASTNDEPASGDDPPVEDIPEPSDDAAPAGSEADNPDSPDTESDATNPDSPG